MLFNSIIRGDLSRTIWKGIEMRLLRLILGIIFTLAGILQFSNTPLVGLGVALLGGAMILDASFEQRISRKDGG